MTSLFYLLLFLLSFYFQAYEASFAQNGKQEQSAGIFYKELAGSPDGPCPVKITR